MKKLEKMDGKLFESLKPNEMSNLGALVGGDYYVTRGTQEFVEGGKIFIKNYTDKQNTEYVNKVGWVDEGCPYEWVYFKTVLDNKNDLESVSLENDYTINN